MRALDILVAGGGIGGLTAARALRRAGHHVTVAERSPGPPATGAGIVLAPNALHVLAALGVDLSEHSHPLPSFDLANADGTVLRRIRPRHPAGHREPSRSLSRSSLHTALHDHLPGEVRFLAGRTVTSVRDTGRKAEVGFAEDPAVHSYDLVVGADGLRSAVREQLAGPVPLRYSGATCWRGITDNTGFTGAVESWGPGTRIGAVPLPGRKLYYYLVATAPRRAPEPDWPDGFRRAFAHHRGEAARLFGTLTEAPPLHHDLEELDTPVWGNGRILLLGDAAHAITPNQGQGAAMAIEDAYALALSLDPGADGAPERYRALRHRRVRRMQLTSRRIGRISHWHSRPARVLRDTALRRLPRFAAQHQYRALVEPALALLREP
ncbi:FAD-dependent monooxygenase [Streptomyces sp. HK10]|uniref:FAD-dependent monooxygenase n=1 Tax=Streptomyces sp. HK10 TaxID=3373255 RepID=UPI0037496045